MWTMQTIFTKTLPLSEVINSVLALPHEQLLPVQQVLNIPFSNTEDTLLTPPAGYPTESLFTSNS